MTELDLLETLLNAINNQLENHGLKIRSGEISIIDATDRAHQSRSRKNTKGENTQDKEAIYNVKVAADGKTTSTYGFKTCINVEEDGFIKKVAHRRQDPRFQLF